jgi:hypothetical protein
MIMRRVAVLAAVVVCLAPAATAQSGDLPLSNWPAPLYWSATARPHEEPVPEGGLLVRGQGMHAQANIMAVLPLAFVATPPCRIVDTRVAVSDGFHQPNFGDDESRTFDFPASTDCPGLPSTARAYSVNIQFRPISQLSYLTAYPTGSTMAEVSTLSAGPAAWVQNAAIVPAGTGGAIDIYCQYAGRVIIDVNGYYGPIGTPGTWLTGGSIGEDGFGGYIGIGVSTITNTESAVSAPSPMTGTIDNFMVSLTESNCTLPRTFTLRTNGTDTAITCTISSGRTCADSTHSVAAAAGDLISVYTTLSGSCVANTWWRARLR